MFGFKGGVKLIDFKELSKGKQIENFPPPEKVIIPLSQHTGTPAKPVVKKGDAVLKGQVIGEAEGFCSSPVHSSISGTVKSMESWSLPGGKTSLSFIIENDGQETAVEGIKNDWRKLEPDEIARLVHQAGIVGMGGAAFPSYIKLTTPEGKKVRHVIINGCECEPFLTGDYRVMKEQYEEIIEGLQIICRALSVKKAYIGLENNKKDIAAILKNFLKDKQTEIDIEVRVLSSTYPQGSEKHLIKSITGREVPSGGLPANIGCIVFNVQTALAIRNAVCNGTPLIERVLTVSGLVKNPRNLRVRIGTPISKILEYCGGEMKPGRNVIIGGPMTGIQIHSAEIPVTKGTTGIIILPEENITEEIQPCIRCGRCIEVCPMNLFPSKLGRLAEKRNWNGCKTLNVEDCIECGSCSYVCPAKRPLTELFKWAKTEIRKIPS
jgi:Na+-translocating ferredoxin:NAD+ oxidoreductase subunit C